MSYPDIACRQVAAEDRVVRCPIRSHSVEVFDEWLAKGLQCSAGKREFKLGRYNVARFRTGTEFAEALELFRPQVAAHEKVGLMAIYVHDESRCDCAEDELWLLGEAMREAGLADSAETVINGDTVCVPIDAVCPVTGKMTTFEFFSVAFCRHARNPRDPLYDPSLGAPFTAINTTSDAFALAMLVHDQSMRAFGCPPYEVGKREDVELLFRKCVTAWQNMSINTIRSYGRLAEDSSRGVHLSEDHQSWFAPHNDPVFAELEKCPFLHEMPIVYASRLCEKWSATMFGGEAYVPSRDGQSGGTQVYAVEGVPENLYEF